VSAQSLCHSPNGLSMTGPILLCHGQTNCGGKVWLYPTISSIMFSSFDALSRPDSCCRELGRQSTAPRLLVICGSTVSKFGLIVLGLDSRALGRPPPAPRVFIMYGSIVNSLSQHGSCCREFGRQSTAPRLLVICESMETAPVWPEPVKAA